VTSLAPTSSIVRARRVTHHAVRAVLVVLALSLVGLIAVNALGTRALVVRSGSMAPAVETGDLIVTAPIRARDAAVGEVITFRDPTRARRLITHRVVSVRQAGLRLAFVTRGDANTGVERWTIAPDGKLGRLFIRVPRAGYALAWLRLSTLGPWLLPVGAALLALVAVRRIWAR
jgi:signal peptidase